MIIIVIIINTIHACIRTNETNKNKQTEFNSISNTMDDIYHLSMEDIMGLKNITKITDSKLAYCLTNIYNYNKNEIVEIQSEQIL